MIKKFLLVIIYMFFCGNVFSQTTTHTIQCTALIAPDINLLGIQTYAETRICGPGKKVTMSGPICNVKYAYDTQSASYPTIVTCSPIVCAPSVAKQFTFFAGWGKTSTDTPENYVPDSDPGPPAPYCDGSCLHTLDSGAAGVDTCHISDQADQGFFPYTCTYNYTTDGNECTAAEKNDPVKGNPPSTEPTSCPDGQVLGQVNGVNTCQPAGDGTGDSSGDGTGDGDGDGTGDGDGDGDGDGTGDGTGDGDGDGTGDGDSDTGGGDGPGGTDDPTAEDCPAGSDLLKCMTLGGVPGSDGISKLTRSLSFMPDNVLGTTASCPADKTINLLSQTITITNMGQACNLLTSYVRPMALLLAFFSSIFIVAGVSNRTD